MSEDNKREFVHAHSKLCKGEAGKTGDWRALRPVIENSKCTPARNQRPSCFICWLYCPEGVVKGFLVLWPVDQTFRRGAM